MADPWDNDPLVGASAPAPSSPGAASDTAATPWAADPITTPAAPADDGSAFENARSAIANVPGAFVGLPHVLAHTADWLAAKGMNAWDGGNRTGADVDQSNPLATHTLAPDEVTTGYTYPILNAWRAAVTGKPPVEPYQPKTPLGELGNAALTAGTAGLVDPLAEASTAGRLINAGKNVVAGGLSDVVKNLTGSDTAAALSAFLGHVGASGVEGAARVGVPAAVEQTKRIVSPRAAGTGQAADVLSGVNSPPGAVPLVNPSDADLTAAQGNVASATNAIGAGASPYQVGQQIRTDLTGRQTALEQARSTATDPIAAARDASTAQVNLDPVLSLFGDKLRTAAGAQKNALEGALADLKMPSGALRANADQLAASRQAINARISTAKLAGDDATAKHLMDVRNALDAQVNAAVPEAGQFTQTYANMSRPLDVFEPGNSPVDAVPNVVARDKFGNLNGTPPSEIPDSFLTGKATKEKLDQLVQAYGGNKSAAETALEQHLAGRVQGAIDPTTGTLDPKAFAKALQPYDKVLNGNGGVWFPALKAKFANATAAQNTLDTLAGQRQIADSITSGGLRDTSGAITGQSFNSWLKDNNAQIVKAYGAPTLMRLQQIGNALKVAGPNITDALTSEVIPGAVGGMLGGNEGAVVGLLNHSVAGLVTRPYTQRVTNAFNSAIERAVQDPAAAQRLAATVGPAARLSGAAVKNAFVRALSATTRVSPS